MVKEWRENLDKKYVVVRVLMDLFKAFHCAAHDHLFAKLVHNGEDDSVFLHIFLKLSCKVQIISKTPRYSN